MLAATWQKQTLVFRQHINRQICKKINIFPKKIGNPPKTQVFLQNTIIISISHHPVTNNLLALPILTNPLALTTNQAITLRLSNRRNQVLSLCIPRTLFNSYKSRNRCPLRSRKLQSYRTILPTTKLDLTKANTQNKLLRRSQAARIILLDSMCLWNLPTRLPWKPWISLTDQMWPLFGRKQGLLGTLW